MKIIYYLNSNLIVHTYTAVFAGGSSTSFRISNEISHVISVQNYLGEMCACDIIRYYVYTENSNQYIKIYLNNSNYVGNIGVKIVGVKQCITEPL